MAIRISRREVLNNIIRLKDKLSDEKEDFNQGKWGKRFYRALLNRQTGDLRFLDEKAQIVPSTEWQEIQIDVEGNANQPAHFDVRDRKNQPLKSKGVTPLAWRIMAETLETLNLIAAHHPPLKRDLLPEEAALEDLSEIHLVQSKDNIEEMPGWKGDIDRIDAELHLEQQPAGTYLLRHAGNMTQLLASNLAKSNQTKVDPYLITIKDVDNKMAEQLILQTDQGWTIYRDNPNLNDTKYYSYFSSFHEALRNLEPRAKMALKD